MSNLRVPSWSKENWHPSEDELFCYVDGELKPPQNQRVKTHLEACWACRVKGEKIQANIASFVSLLDRAVTQEEDLQFPPRQWRTFEAKVSKIMSEFGRPSRLSRWSASLREGFFAIYLPFRLVGGLALIAALAFLVFRFHRPPAVSASELLGRAVEVEVHQIRTRALPVVYQELQIRRKANAPQRDDIVTLEIWNDSSSGRFARREVESDGRQISHVPLDRTPELTNVSPILMELGQIFRANRIDGRNPLSPATHETWRKAVQRKEERVQETKLSDGRKGLVLSTNPSGPFSPNSIIQADLVLRVEDWHPVAEILRIQGNGGVRQYELTETHFDLLALNSLSPAIFAAISPVVPRVLPQATIVTPVLAPATTDLIAAEIKARYALHRVKACLGEPIKVLTRELGRVEVRGLAETPERKEELIAALQDIPLVTVKIQSVAEAQATMPPASTPVTASAQPNADTSQQAQVITVRANKLPIQDALQRYFTQISSDSASSTGNTRSAADTHQRIANLSSQAMSLADAALADAFALRQLIENYPSVKTRILEASSRWLLEAMVREHLQSVRTGTQRSRTLLEPVLRSLDTVDQEVAHSDDTEEVAPAVDSAGQIQQLFQTIRRMERLTAFLFAGGTLPEEEGKHAVAGLLTGFDQVDRQSQGMADYGSRPDRSDSAALTHER